MGATVNQSTSTHRVISFGAFRCDLSARELHKNGIKVKMADQPFRLLAMLLERPGELVTRQELEQELWPGQAELDRADNLNTAIKKVRVALDDEAERPRFIETLPRRGYCFIGHVEDVNGNGSSPHSNGVVVENELWASDLLRREDRADVRLTPDQASRESALRPVTRAAIAFTAIAGVLFAVWWFTPLRPPHLIRIDQITYSGRIDTPVRPVSDGEGVYYIQRAGDRWNLMKTMLGEGDGSRIEVPGKSAMVLDVSPDHTKLLVATFEKRDGQDELWLVPSQGGAATRLGVIAPTAVFSPDGKQIAYANGNSLFMMDADGLHRKKLATFSGSLSWLAWSPDGTRLRFTISPPSNDAPGYIAEVSVDGKNLHPVSLNPVDPSSACCGSWTQDGRYYIFSSSQGGAEWNIWAIREHRSWRRNPWGAVQLTFGPNSALSGIPTSNGKRLFYYSGVWREEMQRYDLNSHRIMPLAIGSEALQPSYSRDGRWIAYIDAQTGGLVRCRTDGSDRLELTSSDTKPTFPRWSPDGEWIAFGGITAGRPTPYVVRAAGGPVQRLLSDAKEARDPDWGNDGRQLVVSRAVGVNGADDWELITVDFKARQFEKIPGAEHLAASRWSPDGRYISATADDQTQLKLFDRSTRRWQVIAHGEALGISVWSPDGRDLYFQDVLGPGEKLRRYTVKTHAVDTVIDFSNFLDSGVSRCALFGTAPDGSPIIGFNRSAYDLFTAELTLP